MKRIIEIFFNVAGTILAGAVLMMFLLTGCGRETEAPISVPANVAVVVGNTNFQYACDAEAVLGDYVRAPGTRITFISATGDGYVIGKDFTAEDYSNKTSIGRETLIADDLETVAENLTAEPNENENDVIAAYNLAATQVSGRKDSYADNVIVIINSGWNTTGICSFADGIPFYKVDQEATIAALQEDMERCDDIRIVLVNIGYVAASGEQDAPTPEERKASVGFYRELFTALGASEVEVIQDIPSEALSYENITVSAIPVGDEVILTQEKSEPEEEPAAESEQEAPQVELPEEEPKAVLTLGDTLFVSDTAELKDPAAAAQIAADNAAQLNTAEHIYLIGSTASGQSEDYCRKLALQRAEVVRQLLLDQGVAVEITCVGVGFSCNALYVYDLDSSGKQDEAIAAGNRCVRVYADSAFAAGLASSGDFPVS